MPDGRGANRLKTNEGRAVERFARSLPEVNFMGALLFDPLWGEAPHPARGLELLHLLKGRMDLLLDGRSYHAEPGDTLIVPSEARHTDSFDPEEGIEVFYCSLNWTAEPEFSRIVNNDILISMAAYRRAELVELFHQLRSEPASMGWGEELLVRSRLHTVLMFMVREAVSRSTESDDAPSEHHRLRLIAAAKAYLRDHYAQRISLEDVARAVNVSGYYLSHLFSEEGEFSLFEYLTAMRMEQARRLLRGGGKNVSEVARAVGYHDPNYFSKVFKKHMGYCPKDFLALTAVHYPRVRSA